MKRFHTKAGVISIALEIALASKEKVPKSTPVEVQLLTTIDDAQLGFCPGGGA